MNCVPGWRSGGETWPPSTVSSSPRRRPVVQPHPRARRSSGPSHVMCCPGIGRAWPVTLHPRFPYAVMAGFLFMDHAPETLLYNASQIDVPKCLSPPEAIHPPTGDFLMAMDRPDPSGQGQFERLYFLLVVSNPFSSSIRAFEVNDGSSEVAGAHRVLLGTVPLPSVDHQDRKHPRAQAAGRSRLAPPQALPHPRGDH